MYYRNKSWNYPIDEVIKGLSFLSAVYFASFSLYLFPLSPLLSLIWWLIFYCIFITFVFSTILQEDVRGLYQSTAFVWRIGQPAAHQTTKTVLSLSFLFSLWYIIIIKYLYITYIFFVVTNCPLILSVLLECTKRPSTSRTARSVYSPLSFSPFLPF